MAFLPTCISCNGARHFSWRGRLICCDRCGGTGLEPTCITCGAVLSDDDVEAERPRCASCGCAVCRSGNTPVAIVDGQPVCDACLNLGQEVA